MCGVRDTGCSDMFAIIRHFMVSVGRTGTFLVFNIVGTRK